MIIVTGAAGFIGSALIGELLREGWQDIVAVDDFSRVEKLPNLEGKKLTARVERNVFFNWLDQNEKQVQFIFHLGARTDTTLFDKAIFDELNVRHFGGLMAVPQLGWSRRPSKTLLGHFDPSHNAIILSRILDRPTVPRLAVEYVLYHEMLHLKHPVEHKGTRRCVHTPEFRADEKLFPHLEEAKRLLRHLS